MWSDSGKPLYVIHRGWGSLFFVTAILIGLATIFAYITFGMGIQPPITFTIIAFGVILLCAFLEVSIVRAFLKSRRVELYEDHLRVFGYNRDGEKTKDLSYSAIEMGPRKMLNSGGHRRPQFVLTINTVPPMSWRTWGDGKVITVSGVVPLYAWLMKKKMDASGKK